MFRITSSNEYKDNYFHNFKPDKTFTMDSTTKKRREKRTKREGVKGETSESFPRIFFSWFLSLFNS